MKKTIFPLVMMLMVALATQTTMAVPVTKADSIVDAKMQGIERVREKIDDALNDTITSNKGSVISVGDNVEMTADDIKEISNQWASVVKQMVISGSFCLLALVLLVLLFRFLNRRSKYNVIEKAIMNNYPLNDITLNDSKNIAYYVPQPIYPASVSNGAPQETPMSMTAMSNWRALMPAVKWMAWGIVFTLFGCCVGDYENPFWPVGLALIFVGLCKGFILYKEQKSLQEAMHRAQKQMPPREPMREGIPVPPPLDNDYKEDNEPYQPY